MLNRYRYLLAFALCSALAVTACGSAQKDWAQKDWAKASTQNTVDAYQSFLDQHAGDPHAQEARNLIATLQDDAAWKIAQDSNSLDSYRQYVSAEPNGTHAQAAHDQIAALQRSSAWKTAQSAGSAEALQTFLQTYPQGPEADLARQKLAALHTDYRAELGSFHTKRAAEHVRSELQSRFSSLLKQVEVLAPDSSNKRYRVMSGLMDHHAADSACSSLKRDHQTCEVVRADQQQS